MAFDSVQSFIELLKRLLTSEHERAEYESDPKTYLAQHGYEELSGHDVKEAMAYVAESLPPDQAQYLDSYLHAPSGAGSNAGHTVTQGSGANQGNATASVGSSGAAAAGSPGAAAAGAPGAAGVAASPAPPPVVPYAGEDDLDAAARHISHITNHYSSVIENNYSSIEDNSTNIDSSVRQHLQAMGDIHQDFDTTVASGDGAVAAGGEVSGPVNTGEISGVMAGDVKDSNLVTGDVGGSFVGGNVSGSVLGDNTGVFAGHDIQDSAINQGENHGIMAGGDVKGAAVGDGNTVLQDLDNNNLNMGGTQNAAQNSTLDNAAFGEGSSSSVETTDVHAEDGAAVALGGNATGAFQNVGDGIGQQNQGDYVEQEATQDESVDDSVNVDINFGDDRGDDLPDLLEIPENGAREPVVDKSLAEDDMALE